MLKTYAVWTMPLTSMVLGAEAVYVHPAPPVPAHSVPPLERSAVAPVTEPQPVAVLASPSHSLTADAAMPGLYTVPPVMMVLAKLLLELTVHRPPAHTPPVALVR